jgi:hypothetical protein
MATREEVSIALRILAYLNNTQSDMRSNANAYLAEIAAGHPRLSTAQLGGIVRADGAAISSLMARMGTFLSVPARQTKATAGLLFFGIASADCNADRLTIKAAADAQAVADVSSDAAITTAANATLAAITPIDVFS